MKKKIIKALILIIIFSLGATFGKLLNWGYFELSKELSIVDALTLFTTLGVAIYITQTLEKEVQDSRIEKELFISKISEIEIILNRIEDLVEDTDCSYNKINNRIHSCRKIKNGIFESIDDNFDNSVSARLKKFEPSISLGINSLKRLLTETPITQTATHEITLTNGLANYSLNRILEINVVINTIKEKLFKLKVNINSL
ncbi:MAG TPA: hypothetical protein VFC65_17030 [Prolixibacteraceae bacterium]|nr:hypothetical protein [Prolixibacteraceae bacterium]